MSVELHCHCREDIGYKCPLHNKWAAMESDKLIEAMARGICCRGEGDTASWQHAEGMAQAIYREMATAALKALRDTLEPVGWSYDPINRVRFAEGEPFMQPNKANMDPRYWTETPLYALPEVKP